MKTSTKNLAKTDDKRICLASDDPDLETQEITVTPESAAQIRKVVKEISTSLNALEVDELEEPLKSTYANIKRQLNATLKKLQPTDQVPAAQRSSYLLQDLLSLLSCSNAMIGHLKGIVASSTSEKQQALASITQEVEKEINAKIKAGELVKKDDVQTQLNTARTDWQTQQTKVSNRRTALASASLPVPADDLLAGEDTAFDARKTKAALRLEKLKPFAALPADKVTALCWISDDAHFDEAVALMGAVALKPTAGTTSNAAPPKGGNPYVAPTPGNNKPTSVFAHGAF